MDSTIEAYLRKAARNLRLANALCDASLEYPDIEWIAIMAFYAAVHFVNAYWWHQQHTTSRDHLDRNTWVWNEGSLRIIRQEYMDLYELSLLVRYQTRYTFRASEAADALAKANMIGNHILSLLPPTP